MTNEHTYPYFLHVSVIINKNDKSKFSIYFPSLFIIKLKKLKHIEACNSLGRNLQVLVLGNIQVSFFAQKIIKKERNIYSDGEINTLNLHSQRAC